MKESSTKAMDSQTPRARRYGPFFLLLIPTAAALLLLFIRYTRPANVAGTNASQQSDTAAASFIWSRPVVAGERIAENMLRLPNGAPLDSAADEEINTPANPRAAAESQANPSATSSVAYRALHLIGHYLLENAQAGQAVSEEIISSSLPAPSDPATFPFWIQVPTDHQDALWDNISLRLPLLINSVHETNIWTDQENINGLATPVQAELLAFDRDTRKICVALSPSDYAGIRPVLATSRLQIFPALISQGSAAVPETAPPDPSSSVADHTIPSNTVGTTAVTSTSSPTSTGETTLPASAENSTQTSDPNPPSSQAQESAPTTPQASSSASDAASP